MFGQGVSVTALQAVSVYQAIANDGLRIPPRLVAGTTLDGVRKDLPRPPGVQVVSPETARTVRTMLEGVTNAGGTGTKGNIPGYRVAGKTGTAQAADPTCGCYRGYTASFIGFAPADDPRLVMGVFLQRPKVGRYGGLLAAPVFQEVMTYGLLHRGIAPSGAETPRGPHHVAVTDTLLTVPTPPGLRPSSVAPRRLGDLAARLSADLVAGRRDAVDTVTVSGVTLDSRAVRPGDLFAALPGSAQHGSRFAGTVAEAGAVALLTDPDGAATCAATGRPVLVVDDPRSVLGDAAAWVYGHPARRLLTLGITGTNGKTTTSFLAESALRALGQRTGLIGTVETRVLDERISSVRTTPEAPDLHGLLAVMVERGVSAAVLEVSSHALSLHRVDGLTFDVAGFTNLSQDHLDFHPTMEDYFRAKASLFTPRRTRRGVICVDDVWGRRLAAEATVPVVTLRTVEEEGTGADWTVIDRHPTATGTAFTLRHRGGRTLRTASPLPGDFNVANAALAIVMLATTGLDAAAAAAGVAAAGVVPGRMERVTGGGAAGGAARRRRLRPHPGRGGRRAGGAAPGGRPAAGGRARRRRRPGPGQAPADGPGRRPVGRRGGRHRRQPALGGPGRDPGGRAGRAPGAAARDRAGGRRPARGDRRARWPRPGVVARCWWPARVTSRARRCPGAVHPFDDRAACTRS